MVQPDDEWLRELKSMRDRINAEIARIETEQNARRERKQRWKIIPGGALAAGAAAGAEAVAKHVREKPVASAGMIVVVAVAATIGTLMTPVPGRIHDQPTAMPPISTHVLPPEPLQPHAAIPQEPGAYSTHAPAAPAVMAHSGPVEPSMTSPTTRPRPPGPSTAPAPAPSQDDDDRGNTDEPPESGHGETPAPPQEQPEEHPPEHCLRALPGLTVRLDVCLATVGDLLT